MQIVNAKPKFGLHELPLCHDGTQYRTCQTIPGRLGVGFESKVADESPGEGSGEGQSDSPNEGKSGGPEVPGEVIELDDNGELTYDGLGDAVMLEAFAKWE